MYKANFGTNTPPQIQFTSENQYYQALGYLARNNNSTSLNWENNQNQGAWGSEGRIHFYINNPSIPGSFSLTAGNGNIQHRTNCNEFLCNLYQNYGFINGRVQDINIIRGNIPTNYLNDFNIGLGLPN
ncbi:hypothetical protein AAX26_00560 [Aliarcobacter thereius]|uniref:hypothetical protein n=1 Tax=Aliarcobacter thereius TaxID=544718 RepID=UPI00082925AC|nr:hypothetical protein [Aliarcobacter thereius]OCL87475.1 hypothetical protein AAX26_00560 [Aliarcobacter thereius]